MCTHLHWDHVGWNTRLESGRWVPTFPNARYVMARREFDHWHAVQQRGTRLFPAHFVAPTVGRIVRHGGSGYAYAFE